MAQTLGDARPPMHHLIMGGLAPYGAWRQVTFPLAVSPAAPALPGCMQNPLARVGGSMSSEPA